MFSRRVVSRISSQRVDESAKQTNRSKVAKALNRKRGGTLCQRSHLYVKRTLFDAAPGDNYRINGEIAGQFARNDRCRGSITGCELRRRLKLLLVRKRQRLGSFLLHHVFSLLPFISFARLAFPSLTSVVIPPNRNSRAFIFSLHFFFSSAAFFFLHVENRAKQNGGETLFHAVPHLRMNSDRAGDNISSLREARRWVGETP